MTELDFTALIGTNAWHEAVIKTVRMVGWQRWHRRATELERTARRYGFFTRGILETHNTELLIPRLYRQAMLTNRPPAILEDPMPRDALSVAVVLASLSDALSPAGQRRLAGLIVDALGHPSGFGPLRSELQFLFALIGQGCKVLPTDLEGDARFDFLAKKHGIEVEVECKFLSHDLGCRPHRRPFQHLCMALYDRHRKLIEQSGSSLVVRVTTEHAPTRAQDIERLADAIGGAIRSKQESAGDNGWQISIAEWQEGKSDPQSVHGEARRLLMEEFSPNVATHTVDSCFIFILKSTLSPVEQAQRQLQLAARTIREAARQFTSRRPAVLSVEFEAQNGDAMHNQGLASRMGRMFQEWAPQRPWLTRLHMGFPGIPFSGGEGFIYKNPASSSNLLLDDLDELSQLSPWPEEMLSWRRRWRSLWPI